MTPNERVGCNVARLRARAGLSQADLARELATQLGKDRIDPTTITRLEQGKRPTTVDELVALGDILGDSVEGLVFGPNEQPAAHVSRADVKRLEQRVREFLTYLDEASR
jgi:transcriptional regulator with XRE-family HTH domain